MHPRLVVRDKTGHYCINGLAPQVVPQTVTTPLGTLRLVRVTPTYVLYAETLVETPDAPSEVL